MNPFSQERFDIIAVGGGPTAACLALAARKAGGNVLRLGTEQQPANRHYALGLRARRFLARSGVEASGAQADRFWLFADGRKTEIVADECGLDSLCVVVSESALLRELREKAGDIPQVCAPPESLSDLRCDSDGAEIVADGKRFCASLIAAADGARSRTAALAGVGVCARTFGQSALSATLRAPLPPDVAAQWFFRDNILALLPVGDGNFSLIWSLPQSEANRLANVGADELAKAVAAQTGTADIAAADSEVAMFPLAAARRAVRVAERVAFAGDSARTIHPLAGQGLNLALLDAEDLIARASSFSDWGDASALSSYAASRSLRAEALHRATAFFAESGGAAGTILAAANIVRPALHAAARFANGY